MIERNDAGPEGTGSDSTSRGKSSSAQWLHLIDALEEQVDVGSLEALLEALAEDEQKTAVLPGAQEQALANIISARVVDQIGLATDVVPPEHTRSVVGQALSSVTGLLQRFVPLRGMPVTRLLPSAALEGEQGVRVEAITFELADYFGRETLDAHLQFAGSRVTLTRVPSSTEAAATYFATIDAPPDAATSTGRSSALLITVTDESGNVAGVRLTADVRAGVLEGTLSTSWHGLTGAAFILE